MERQPTIEPYLARRKALMEQAGDGVILVRGDAGSDVNPNFLYLTGIAEPRAVLLLAPAGTRVHTGARFPGPNYVRGEMVRQILFLPAPDPFAARWGESGPVDAGVAPDVAGVDAVFDTGMQHAVLDVALASTGRLHYVRGQRPSLAGDDDVDARFVERIRRRFFHLELADATSFLHEARRLKDEGEIARIERSVNVVAEALDRALGTVRAGARESAIEAEIAAVYRRHGGTHAFDPIVAGGDRALILHYTRNDSPVEAGQLLLIDTGVSIDGYKADITRTVPVDGRFTDRQREVYEAVLAALEASIEFCRPGALIADIHQRAHESLDAAGFASSFVHGIGHHLGLETHDVGDTHTELAPGAVITIEPGVYLADEGIGVRIEDDVLITESGCRVLSEGIPRSVAAVEQWMGAR